MKIAIFLFNILFISFLNARPISYADSWTLMSYNDYKKNSILIHYTPTSKYSIGYKSEYWQEEKHWLNSSSILYLPRWKNWQTVHTISPVMFGMD